MKILRYIILISSFSGIFLLVYRQSDKTSFPKWSMSFKTAAFIAAILAGLIPNPVKQIELDVPTNLPSISRVILVKTGDTSPSVPTSSGREQPTNFPSGTTGGRRTSHVNPYRTPPKLVDRELGFGAGANPAGAGGEGGAAEFDDNSPVPNKKQSQQSKTFDYDYRSNDPKKKKQSAEQCKLDENVKDGKIEIVYGIKENPALVRESKRISKDQAAKKDVNNLIEQLSLGNDNPGIGNRRVKGLKNVSEARGRNEGRVYFREKNGKIEILAKSNKDNQNKVIDIL
jgi:hypothetical protein